LSDFFTSLLHHFLLDDYLKPAFIECKKGGGLMAYWLVVTIGFLMCLGMVGGTFIYYLRTLALDPQDSINIDPKE